MKRLLFVSIFCLASFSANAQLKPKLYAGLNAFYNKAYEPNVFGGFEVGAEIFRFHFLAPEIGLSYWAGQPNEREQLDFNSQPPQAISRFDGRFNSFNVSVAPKLIFGNEEAALVFLPQYNFGRLNVSERFFQPVNDRYEMQEEVSDSKNIGFWNFSAGIQGDFFGLEHIRFAVLLTYTTFDSEKAFEDLQFSTPGEIYQEGSSDGLGITFRAYFDIFKN